MPVVMLLYSSRCFASSTTPLLWPVTCLHACILYSTCCLHVSLPRCGYCLAAMTRPVHETKDPAEGKGARGDGNDSPASTSHVIPQTSLLNYFLWHFQPAGNIWFGIRTLIVMGERSSDKRIRYVIVNNSYFISRPVCESARSQIDPGSRIEISSFVLLHATWSLAEPRRSKNEIGRAHV